LRISRIPRLLVVSTTAAISACSAPTRFLAARASASRRALYSEDALSALKKYWTPRQPARAVDDATSATLA